MERNSRNMSHKALHARTAAVKNCGSMCEVMSLNNTLLFAGSLGTYDERRDQLSVHPRRGKEIPREILHGTCVKLLVRPAAARGKVTLIYGTLLPCGRDVCYVRPEDELKYTESRKNFRLPVQVPGSVCRKGEYVNQSCALVDISLSGVCFQSHAIYALNDEITLSNVRLLPEGAVYSIRCSVVRREAVDKTAPFSKAEYGCRFINMSKREQDVLCGDLFALQARTLQERRMRV